MLTVRESDIYVSDPGIDFYDRCPHDFRRNLAEYGAKHPLELAKPYLNDTIFPHRSATVCFHTDPQVVPSPRLSWAFANDGTSEGNRSAQLLPQPSDNGAVFGRFVQPVLAECQGIGNLQAGSLAITASVGAPVSQQVTRVAAVSDTLTLTVHRNDHAIRFIASAEYVGPKTASDLFLSNDGVLHFPGGGALFTNGTDSALRARPAIRRSAPRSMYGRSWTVPRLNRHQQPLNTTRIFHGTYYRSCPALRFTQSAA